jgi:hypothetical protein
LKRSSLVAVIAGLLAVAGCGGGAEIASAPVGKAGIGIAVAYLDVSGWHVHRGHVTTDVPAGLHPRAWSYAADQLVLVDDTEAAFLLGPRASTGPRRLCGPCQVLPIGATDAGGFVRLDVSGLTWMTADGRDVQTVHVLAQPPGTTSDVVAAAPDWAVVTYSAADGTHTVSVVPRAGTPRVYLPPDAFYNVPLHVGVVNPDGLRASIPSGAAKIHACSVIS